MEKEEVKTAKCWLCGDARFPGELRPYGPNGKNICVVCARKNEPATKRRLIKLLVAKMTKATPACGSRGAPKDFENGRTWNAQRFRNLASADAAEPVFMRLRS
jgi:hypothetical protein